MALSVKRPTVTSPSLFAISRILMCPLCKISAANPTYTFFGFKYSFIFHYFKVFILFNYMNTRLIAKVEIKNQNIVKPIYFEGLKKLAIQKKLYKKFVNMKLTKLFI